MVALPADGNAAIAPKLYADTCPHCTNSLSFGGGWGEVLPAEYLSAIEKAFNATLKQLYSGKTPDSRMFTESGKALAANVQDSYAPTAAWTAPDAEMLARLTRDVWQFSAAKNFQELKDFTLALKDENGNLREWSDFKNAAEKTANKYNITWMRTEYDQCIAAAQNAARWVEYEQNAETMPNLQYQTVGDSNVRETHRVLNGITRPITDDFWATHYPPNGWGCRCEALQVPDGLAPVTPDENIPPTPVPPMFRTNLAKTGLIFPKGHPYYRGIPRTELLKAMAYLPPENGFTNVTVGDKNFDVHILHGESELRKNIEAINALLQLEPDAQIKLLPIILIDEKRKAADMAVRKKFLPDSYLKKFPEKNPDMIFNNMVVEIENAQPTRTSIVNAIQHGKKQANIIFIKVPDDVDIENLYNIANGQMKNYRDKEDLTVWLYNSSKKAEYITHKRQ